MTPRTRKTTRSAAARINAEAAAAAPPAPATVTLTVCAAEGLHSMTLEGKLREIARGAARGHLVAALAEVFRREDTPE